MTNIERIRNETCSCEHDKLQLLGYIDTLEKALKETRQENAKLIQRTAQFERMKEKLKKVRE